MTHEESVEAYGRGEVSVKIARITDFWQEQKGGVPRFTRLRLLLGGARRAVVFFAVGMCWISLAVTGMVLRHPLELDLLANLCALGFVSWVFWIAWHTPNQIVRYALRDERYYEEAVRAGVLEITPLKVTWRGMRPPHSGTTQQ
jgi:hypothetical protein